MKKYCENCKYSLEGEAKQAENNKIPMSFF